MLLVSLAVLVPLSTAAHYGIEKIFLDWKSRLRRAV
jgi:peptidoglycan/LPS O-acetylase OafA/YrhL